MPPSTSTSLSLVSSRNAPIAYLKSALFLSIPNTIAFPPGRTSGHQRRISDLPSGFRNSCGVPPPAETRKKPSEACGRKIIESSGSHVAPAISPELQRVMTPPPPTATFLSLPSKELKPIHWPSGEKNGYLTPSVP